MSSFFCTIALVQFVQSEQVVPVLECPQNAQPNSLLWKRGERGKQESKADRSHTRKLPLTQVALQLTPAVTVTFSNKRGSLCEAKWALLVFSLRPKANSGGTLCSSEANGDLGQNVISCCGNEGELALSTLMKLHCRANVFLSDGDS